MFKSTQKVIVFSWNFIFNHEVSPLRHIPDVAVRHYVLQILGVMWAVCFSVAIGSYTFFAISLLGHLVLIAAVAITVATLTAAKAKPELFPNGVDARED
jgi:hypothetical protein